ncbi:MAG TPA: hypothetical protein VFB96_25740 [Pirellulaceae bacterium]|nr:hypothetical protein [Pirellulaceae bacterium]
MMQKADMPAAAGLSRGQFGLAHLFGLTTIAAGAAALVAWFGPGTLLTSGCVLVAWLNLCGLFNRLHSGTRQATMLWCAWAIFLISFALPSIAVLGPVLGWGAAWVVLMAPVDMLRGVRGFDFSFLWCLWMDAANLLGVLLPVLVWRVGRGQGQWLGSAFCLAMVSTGTVLWDNAMLVGYYVWCASFLMALVALPVKTKTFLAMLAAVALWAAVVAWNGWA